MVVDEATSPLIVGLGASSTTLILDSLSLNVRE